MRIAVCIPSYGRPDKCRVAVESALLGGAVVCLGLDAADPAKPKYRQPYHVFPADAPTTWKWNKLAEDALGLGADIIVLGSDDIVFETPQWANMLRQRVRQFPDRILAVGFNDGRAKGSVPHYAVTREWIDGIGYFCPPIFHHWCVDIWTQSIGARIGRYQYAEDIVVRHDTVKITGKVDRTHSRIREGVWHPRDMSLYSMSEHYRAADAEKLRKLCL